MAVKKHRKYIEKIFRSKNVIEHEFSYKGKYGAKGEKRAPKKKATKEQIAYQNQVNREKRIRRTLLLNFMEGDLWVCLKYPEGYRLSLDEVEKDLDKFIANTRYAYRKLGHELKWYVRVDIGELGGIHAHIAVNRLWEIQTDVLLEQKWRYLLKKRGIEEKDRSGKVDWKAMYEAGGFEELAKYIAYRYTEEDEEYEQLSLFDEEEQKRLSSVRCSRNLIRPEPEVVESSKKTMRQIVDFGPEPTPGFYIDKNSIFSGINPYTGLSYLHYTEYRIRGTTERGQPWSE